MNRLIVAWKRILHRKLYWCMLGVLLILTGIYALLPAKSQSTEIRVAVYLEDTSAYTTQFKEELDASASLYQFYYVDASTRRRIQRRADGGTPLMQSTTPIIHSLF